MALETHRSAALRTLILLCGTALVGPMMAGPARGQEARKVLAVVTCDSYADIKSQLAWLGGQISQPGLAGMLETGLMLATQGRGVTGLDVKRPLGVVLSTADGDVGVHGFVPVKDLDKLLDSLKGVTGPAEEAGDARMITLPSGLALELAEKDGWAIVAPQGMAAGPVDHVPLLTTLSDNYSLAIELFPSVLPEGLRQQLRFLLEQAAAQAAQQGRQVDPRAMAAFVESLSGAESVLLGVTIDPTKRRVFIENRVVGTPGSPLARAMEGSGEGTLTVAMPPAKDGGRPAISGYLVQAVPPEAQGGVAAALDAALPAAGGDALTGTLRALAGQIVDAVLSTGGIDAAVAVDPPAAAAAAEKRPPAVTAGVRVKNGPALEAGIKKAFGPGGAARDSLPPGVKLSFDTGKAATANLHTIRVDLAGTEAADRLGDAVDLTLAVTPEYAFLLAGEAPTARVEALLGPRGRIEPGAKPIGALSVDVARILGGTPADPQPVGTPRPAEDGGEDGRPPSRLTLLVRPVDRGIATRLSADAAALEAAVAAGGAAAGGGLPPANGGPIPLPRR